MKKIFILIFLIGLTACDFNYKKINTVSQTSEEKSDWMSSCNKMKNSFDHIKMNTVSRCLSACDKVVNSKIKNVKIRESNFSSCTDECQKAKIDIFEDVFFIERKIDEKLKCHYRY